MQLSQDQKKAIEEWIQSGADLNKIQQNLKEEFALKLTYLDTRFLLGDLGLEIIEEEEEINSAQPEEKVDPAIPKEKESEFQEQETLSEDPEEGKDNENENETTNVNLTVDSLTQPQCIISGKATFSDGKGAAWYIDQLGRLGLNPDEEGYSPTQEDLAVFQIELRNVLSKQGL